MVWVVCIGPLLAWLAFELGSKGVRDQEFRSTLIQQMQLGELTDRMIDTIKETIAKSS